MDILSILKSYLKNIRDNVIIEGQSEYLSLWETEYAGYNPEFHNYKVYKDGVFYRKTKKSLKSCKLVSNDWANLIANEKMEITVKEKDQPKLDEILKTNNFKMLLNLYYEYAFALSLSSAILTIDGITVNEDGKVVSKTGVPKISFVNAKQIYPITIEGGKITEIAFACENTNYVDLIIYLLNKQGNYEIHSLKCPKNKKGSLSVPSWESANIFDTQSKYKWFTCHRPAIANNLNLDSSLPISIFANSIDTSHAIDNKYDGFDEEFVSGKRRIFVSAEATKPVKVQVSDKKGGTKLVEVDTFDPNDTVIYTLPTDRDSSKKDLIHTAADALRSNDFIASINAELSYMAKQCGLGNNRYFFAQGGEATKTATEVISIHSELYQNLRKHELILEQELSTFILALIEACNNFTDIKFDGNYTYKDIAIKFDDSIIEDTDVQQTRDRTNVGAGLMAEKDFIEKWLGKTKDDAEQYVLDNLRYKLIAQNLPALQSGVMMPKDFIEICYKDYNEAKKTELEQYIVEQLNKSSISALDFQNPDNPEDDDFTFSE